MIEGKRSSQSAFAHELIRNVIQSALKPRGDLIDFGNFDDERRGEHQAVADYAQDQSVAPRGGINTCPDVERTAEGSTLLAVVHELHSEYQARPAHIADQRMQLQAAQRRAQHRTESLCSGDVISRISLRRQLSE